MMQCFTHTELLSLGLAFIAGAVIVAIARM